MPRTVTEITPKQQRFIDEFIIDLNGTKALLRAGYKAKNENVAAVTAAELLRKPHIAQAIAERTQTLSEQAGIKTVEVLREAARISLSDPGQLFDEDGKLLPINKLPEDIRRCVASVKVREVWQGRGESREFAGYETEVRLWDKNSAQDRLFKHLGLFPKELGTKDNPVEHRVTIVYEKLHTQN